MNEKEKLDASSKYESLSLANIADKIMLEGFFLHFFANVNLASDAVQVLNPSGFSLIRNRILGLATLTPGLTISQLVQALRVSHQNINAPLRSLANEGYIDVVIGSEDRRQRHLHATGKGRQLFLEVLDHQMNRVRRAFSAAGPEAVRGFLEVQRHLVEQSDLAWIERMLQMAETAGPDEA